MFVSSLWILEALIVGVLLQVFFRMPVSISMKSAVACPSVPRPGLRGGTDDNLLNLGTLSVPCPSTPVWKPLHTHAATYLTFKIRRKAMGCSNDCTHST